MISGNEDFGVEAAAGRIIGNHIGVDRGGSFPLPNHEAGIHAVGPVQIGGRTEAERNVISGNDADVLVDGAAVVEGNWIGPAADGNELGNDFPLLGRKTGIRLRPGSQGASIAGNAVGGQEVGVESVGEVREVSIEDNVIGFEPDGTTPLDTLVGILIGEDTAGLEIADNTIGANFRGLGVSGDGTRVERNTIGLDTTGEPRNELGDEQDGRVGVVVQPTAEDTKLTDNTVSGLPTGIELRENSGTVVEGNRVGTDTEGEEERQNLAGIVTARPRRPGSATTT